MSDPWKLTIFEYHGATTVVVGRPYRTWPRKRLKYTDIRRITVSGGTEHRQAAIQEALHHVPKSADYEEVVIT